MIEASLDIATSLLGDGEIALPFDELVPHLIEDGSPFGSTPFRRHLFKSQFLMLGFGSSQLGDHALADGDGARQVRLQLLEASAQFGEFVPHDGDFDRQSSRSK